MRALILAAALFVTACQSTAVVSGDHCPVAPGELLIAPATLPRLDDTKPMPPIPSLIETMTEDAGRYRDVVTILGRLQDWLRTECRWGVTAVSNPASEPSSSSTPTN